MVANSCVSSISGFLTAPYTAWLPVVIVAALMVITVLGLFYILAPLAGRNDFRAWSRIKIYDVLLGILLVFIFASISTTMCAVNIAPAYQGAGLLDKTCAASTSVNNIYSVSLCNVYEFNDYARIASQQIFIGQLVAAAIPSLNIGFQFLPGFGFTFDIQGWSLRGLSFVLDTLYTMEMLNQIQVLLLAIAPLIFAAFMAIGLIVRMFGVTRTFGGALIAFALGIGFIYPLLTGITYGFIDVTLGNLASSWIGSIGAVANGLAVFFFNALGSPVPQAYTVIGIFSGIQTSIYQIIEYIGVVSIGLSIIPFINFVILDAFIVDFSSAIGERMSFFDLLINVV